MTSAGTPGLRRRNLEMKGGLVTGFRILLAGMLAILAIYTAIVVADHGLGLVPVFFGDIAKMGWPGQFNLDFLGFLILAALWTAWRRDFSPSGVALGALALVGGMSFLTVYLLIVSYRTKGDVKIMLLGPRRAAS